MLVKTSSFPFREGGLLAEDLQSVIIQKRFCEVPSRLQDSAFKGSTVKHPMCRTLLNKIVLGISRVVRRVEVLSEVISESVSPALTPQHKHPHS